MEFRKIFGVRILFFERLQFFFLHLLCILYLECWNEMQLSVQVQSTWVKTLQRSNILRGATNVTTTFIGATTILNKNNFFFSKHLMYSLFFILLFSLLKITFFPSEHLMYSLSSLFFLFSSLTGLLWGCLKN